MDGEWWVFICDLPLGNRVNNMDRVSMMKQPGWRNMDETRLKSTAHRKVTNETIFILVLFCRVIRVYVLFLLVVAFLVHILRLIRLAFIVWGPR